MHWKAVGCAQLENLYRPFRAQDSFYPVGFQPYRASLSYAAPLGLNALLPDVGPSHYAEHDVYEEQFLPRCAWESWRGQESGVGGQGEMSACRMECSLFTKSNSYRAALAGFDFSREEREAIIWIR